jgi:hypothetical protein
VDRLLAAKAEGPSLHWPGRLLRVADGTWISKPAGTNETPRSYG